MPTTTSAHLLLRDKRMLNSDLPEECWELITRFRGELLNQAFALLGNREDAEDVVQETFADAFRDRACIAELNSIGAWLRSLNRDNALTRLRLRQATKVKTERRKREAPGRTATTGGFSVLELRESLAQAIETLPEQHRAVVVLRYWEDLQHEEIAKRLALPSSSVRRLFHEATVKLYQKLQPHLNPGIVRGGDPV